MGRIHEDNAASIGRTPLVRINNITKGARATVLAKIEGRNPAYSVKCRIGASMVWDAEKRGVLKKGKAILEATSGNTGIALAFAAAARGYDCVLVMPETMSMERRKVLVALGAKLVLTPGSVGMTGAIAKTEELAAAEPGRYVMMKQSDNPANPAIHESTTGPEIWDDTAGTVDVKVRWRPGGRVAIQDSTNLLNWRNRYTNLAPYIFQDSPAASTNCRFYRGWLLP